MFSYCSGLDTVLTLLQDEILDLTPGEPPKRGRNMSSFCETHSSRLLSPPVFLRSCVFCSIPPLLPLLRVIMTLFKEVIDNIMIPFFYCPPFCPISSRFKPLWFEVWRCF